VAATPDSPRLTPLPPKEWSKAAGAALAPLLPPTGRPKGENGSTLSARHRELLVLRVATVRGAEYEWRQHVASAGDNGVGPDEVACVTIGPDAPGWSDLERALLRAVDELLGDALIADDTWSTLAGELDVQQLMEVVFTVGAYDTLAMALRTFGVPLDDDLERP
jgi:alkylhydroperoxidase family enzyme